MKVVDTATLPLDELFALPDPAQLGELPVLDPDEMVANIQRMHQLIAGMRDDLLKVPDVAAMVEALDSMERPPVWVVSTGRCGTLALDKWLHQSSQTTPFHRNMWFQASRPLVDISIHRRRMAFWRLFTGTFNEASLWHDILYLTHLIAPDVIQQARAGRSWIMTNHGVAPWAPYLLGLCPRLNVLHLRRRPEDTFNSCLWNGHWSNQVIPMRTRHIGGAERILAEPLEQSMGSQIAFFLAATDTIGEAMLRSVPESQGLFLESETLYRAELKSWEALISLTGIADLPFDSFQANYAKKTNAKAARKFVPSEEYRKELEGRLRLVMSAFQGDTLEVPPGPSESVHRAWASQLNSKVDRGSDPDRRVAVPFFAPDPSVQKPGTGDTRCFSPQADRRGARPITPESSGRTSVGSEPGAAPSQSETSSPGASMTRGRTNLQAAYREQLTARPGQSRR